MTKKVFKNLEKKIKQNWKKPVTNYTVWKIGKKYEVFEVESPPELVGICSEFGEFINVSKK